MNQPNLTRELRALTNHTHHLEAQLARVFVTLHNQQETIDKLRASQTLLCRYIAAQRQPAATDDSAGVDIERMLLDVESSRGEEVADAAAVSMYNLLGECVGVARTPVEAHQLLGDLIGGNSDAGSDEAVVLDGEGFAVDLDNEDHSGEDVWEQVKRNGEELYIANPQHFVSASVASHIGSRNKLVQMLNAPLPVSQPVRPAKAKSEARFMYPPLTEALYRNEVVVHTIISFLSVNDVLLLASTCQSLQQLVLGSVVSPWNDRHGGHRIPMCFVTSGSLGYSRAVVFLANGAIPTTKAGGEDITPALAKLLPSTAASLTETADKVLRRHQLARPGGAESESSGIIQRLAAQHVPTGGCVANYANKQTLVDVVHLGQADNVSQLRRFFIVPVPRLFALSAVISRCRAEDFIYGSLLRPWYVKAGMDTLRQQKWASTGEQFVEGCVADVLDTVNKWYHATVVEIARDPILGVPRKVKIHYETWGNRWDEWVDIGSPRLQPFGSMYNNYDSQGRYSHGEVRFVHCRDALRAFGILSHEVRNDRRSISDFFLAVLRHTISDYNGDATFETMEIEQNVSQPDMATLAAFPESSMVDPVISNRTLAQSLCMTGGSQFRRVVIYQMEGTDALMVAHKWNRWKLAMAQKAFGTGLSDDSGTSGNFTRF